MENDVYTRLREYMDLMPGGYPPTPSKIEIKLLKKLFTPEQAEITLKLSPLPEPIDAIAGKLGMDESTAMEKLEHMANEGLIVGFKINEKMHYMAVSFVVGIYELHLNNIDKELAEMFEEYLPYIGMRIAGVKTKQLRVLPVASAMDQGPNVAPYNKVRESVKSQQLASVAHCICRKEQKLMGHGCDRPEELCLQFGYAARYAIDRGLAREISIDEALRMLDVAEKNAMVLSPANSKDLMNICTCCGCCCGLMKNLKMLPNPAAFVQTSYQAKIDPETCSACETCLERCQVNAIKQEGDVMVVQTERCIGCGLCVDYCPEEAISLVDFPGAEEPPQSIIETMLRIAKERKLPWVPK